jgi:CRP-like cAMP-binding protein
MDLLEIFKDSEDIIYVPAKTVVIREGDEGNKMYVVMDGEVSISIKDRVIATAGDGEIVGEMALISPDLRSATVTATADSHLAVIDQASFDSLLNHVPEFTMHVMDVLADRLKAAFEMIEES